LCTGDETLKRARSILAQESVYGASSEYLSQKQVEDYFIADPDDISSFFKAVELPDYMNLIETLCQRTLGYIQDIMQWTLPMVRGYYYSDGSWVDVSETAMTDLARELDLAGILLGREVGDGYGIDDLIQTEIPAESKVFQGKFRYTPGELALRLAYIFNVYPSEQADTSSSSVLEMSPIFGDSVKQERKPVWNSIVRESVSWVDSALYKLPGSLNALTSWFGGNDNETLQAVRTGLMGMVKTLTNTKIMVGEAPTCGPDSSTMAYVSVFVNKLTGEFVGGEKHGDRHVINVCERFWMDEFFSDPASKFGTIVHESSHHQGTTDEKYKGAEPYGRAQCLRMASEAPAKALNNADNFKWLVYYLNRCANAPSSVSQEAPCSLKLRLHAGSSVRVYAICTRQVVGATLKLVGSDGTYLQRALNFGKLGPGDLFLETLIVPIDAKVQFFFEFDCVMWEADGQWLGTDLAAPAKQILALSSGGDLTDEPPSPTSAGFELPCELSLDASVRLVGGDAGFNVLVECSHTVTNVRLTFAGPFDTSPHVPDKSFGTLPLGKSWKIFTHELDTFSGFTFTLFGSVGSKTSSKTITLASNSAPPLREESPELPCELILQKTTLQSGELGIEVKVKCLREVANGILKFPGTNFKEEKINGKFAAGTMYTLLKVRASQATSFEFEASYVGGTGSVFKSFREDTSDEKLPLPCELILKKITMPSGDRGVDIKVTCSKTVANGILKFPGTKFTEERFTNMFEADRTYSLMTVKTSQATNFEFQATYIGNTNSIFASSFGAPEPSRPKPDSQSVNCHAFCKERHCSPSNNLYTFCKDCDSCKSGSTPPAQSQPSSASKCTMSYCYSSKSFCEPSSRLFDYCGGCDHCKQAITPPVSPKPSKPRASACHDSCTEAYFCKASSPMYKYCYECSMCKDGGSSSHRRTGGSHWFDRFTVPEEKTKTCGMFTECDRSDPGRYCSGWRKPYCGGCSWCTGSITRTSHVARRINTTLRTHTWTETCGMYLDCDPSEPSTYCNGWRRKYCGGCSWC
jgi:hypothetical protein